MRNKFNFFCFICDSLCFFSIVGVECCDKLWTCQGLEAILDAFNVEDAVVKVRRVRQDLKQIIYYVKTIKYQAINQS